MHLSPLYSFIERRGFDRHKDSLLHLYALFYTTTYLRHGRGRVEYPDGGAVALCPPVIQALTTFFILESRDSRRSDRDAVGRAHRAMEKNRMLGEMFDGVVKQMTHFLLLSLLRIGFFFICQTQTRKFFQQNLTTYNIMHYCILYVVLTHIAPVAQ